MKSYMSPQASVAAFLIITNVLVIDVLAGLSPFKAVLLVTGGALIFAFFAAVFADCLVTGGCDWLAWTLVALLVLQFLGALRMKKMETLAMQAPAPHSENEGTYQTVHNQQVYYGKDVPGVLPFGETPP